MAGGGVEMSKNMARFHQHVTAFLRVVHPFSRPTEETFVHSSAVPLKSFSFIMEKCSTPLWAFHFSETRFIGKYLLLFMSIQACQVTFARV